MKLFTSESLKHFLEGKGSEKRLIEETTTYFKAMLPEIKESSINDLVSLSNKDSQFASPWMRTTSPQQRAEAVVGMLCSLAYWETLNDEQKQLTMRIYERLLEQQRKYIVPEKYKEIPSPFSIK